MVAQPVHTITGKVLIQVGDREPVEVGTIDIPLQIVPLEKGPVYRPSGGRPRNA
ncbi:MAG: hypothetical protein J7474_01440 [Arthrobacter sp.]|nr:hypothetical protein [Arthrobacter sp.]